MNIISYNNRLNELKKMESVRNYLLDNGIIDSDGIKDYNDTEL